MSSISAGTTSSTALVATADTSGALVLQTNNGTTAVTLDTSQNATFVGTLTTAAKGIAKASLPAGAVLQVLQSFKTDTYSQTSQTFTVITGLTVSITPTSSTSKILVMAQIGCNGLVGADSWYFAVGRGGSVVTASTGDAASNRPRGTAVVQQADGTVSTQNGQWTIPIMFLDSPATTSSTTYSIMGRTANGSTLYINRTSSDRDTTGYDGRWTSSITVMEIAV
jgi:hypothetical protein